MTKLLKFSRPAAILVGLVFLVSGYAKAADCAYFSNILWHTYSNEWLALIAPGVIGIELILGWLLLLGWKHRWTAWAAIAFTVCLSAGFLWGVTAHGMYDCGCFGHLEMLNLPPVWTIVRNAVMIVLLLLSALSADCRDHHVYGWSAALLAVGLMVGGAMAGATFHDATILSVRSAKYSGEVVEDTPLSRLQLSSDSTYLVFCFSYHCPYCMAAVGNIAPYAESGIVDRVIGLAVADSAGGADFRDFYGGEPFPITDLPVDSLMQISDDLPTAFFVRNDTVLATWVGEVPPAYFFRSMRKR